jgi:hypothetical protein
MILCNIFIVLLFLDSEICFGGLNDWPCHVPICASMVITNILFFSIIFWFMVIPLLELNIIHFMAELVVSIS